MDAKNMESQLRNNNLSAVKEKYNFLVPGLMMLMIFLMKPGYSLYCPQWYFIWMTTESIGLFSLALLFLRPRFLFQRLSCIPVWINLALLVMALIGLWHMAANPNTSFEYFGTSILYVTIPLLVYVYIDEFRKILPPFLAYVWLWNAILCFCQHYATGVDMYGITGNRNWTASLIVATAPFAAYMVYRISARLDIPKMTRIIFGVGAVVIFSAWMLWIIASRGALVSLLTVLLFYLILLLKGEKRKYSLYAIIGLLVIAVLCVFLFLDKIAFLMLNDERAIMFNGAIDMISNRPLVGYGAASFEQEYLAFQPVEFFFHKHAAARMNHPHNHFLYIAAGFGLLGLFAWLLLIFAPIIRFIQNYDNEKSIECRLFLFSFCAVLVHSLFDLLLERSPIDVIALLMLGVLWGIAWTHQPETVPETADAAGAENTKLKPLKLCCFLIFVSGIFIFGFALFSTVRSAYSSTLLFKADVARLQRRYADEARYLWNSAEISTNPEVIYQALKRAEISWQDNKAALKLAERIRENTVQPDYVYTNSFAAAASFKLGDPIAAANYLNREIDLYPTLLIPLFNLLGAYEQLGDTENYDLTQRRFWGIMKERGINPDMFQFILMNPDYDLLQWKLMNEIKFVLADSQNDAEEKESSESALSYEKTNRQD